MLPKRRYKILFYKMLDRNLNFRIPNRLLGMISYARFSLSSLTTLLPWVIFNMYMIGNNILIWICIYLWKLWCYHQSISLYLGVLFDLINFGNVIVTKQCMICNADTLVSLHSIDLQFLTRSVSIDYAPAPAKHKNVSLRLQPVGIGIGNRDRFI